MFALILDGYYSVTDYDAWKERLNGTLVETSKSYEKLKAIADKNNDELEIDLDEIAGDWGEEFIGI